MFGYVVANTEKLSEEQLLRYRSLYCGLCRTLKERHGTSARMVLTYDLVFLILTLSSVFKAEDRETGEEACPVHPLRKHPYTVNAFTAYAADMNVALAYYNCLDDWTDDKSLGALCEAKLLGRKYERTEQEYPRQCRAIRDCLDGLADAERRGESNPDVAANFFGILMGELFRYDESELSEALYDFGFALGKFIYIMDAFVDLKADIRKQRYNPMVRYTGAEVQPILDILMAQCTEIFQALPVEADKDLMENILYSGVWTKAEMLKTKGERKRNG